MLARSFVILPAHDALAWLVMDDTGAVNELQCTAVVLG